MILYKYYGYSSGVMALQSKKLAFREARYFNDPFELTYLDKSSGLDGISQFIKGENLAILSLTRTPLNPLMWAHYAEDHRGFVIGYDVDDEFFQSKKYNLISVNEGAVIYTTEKEEMDIPTDPQNALVRSITAVCIGEESENPPEDTINLLKKAFLHKHLCWAYEEEVRVVKVLDSLFEESAVRQCDLNRRYGSLNKMVAPGIAVVTVRGLHLFDKEAKIKEVYLGMRNPLLNPRENDSIQYDGIFESSKNLAWTVNKTFMSSGSWGLESTPIQQEFLIIPKETKGLINEFSLNGEEAEYLSKLLPGSLSAVDDRYEFTNFSGKLSLKKNGKFI